MCVTLYILLKLAKPTLFVGSITRKKLYGAQAQKVTYHLKHCLACVYENIAFNYALYCISLSTCPSHAVLFVHMCGGEIRAFLLCLILHFMYAVLVV